MHPALSVIIFTTLSGIGFGLMSLLGIGLGGDTLAFRWTAVVLAYGFAVIGLLSSVAHLKSPARAIHAFSQWRSSWLSREGVLSVLTLGVFGLWALAFLFMDTSIGALGIAAALLALVTIFSTSMIYAQLRTVPHWATWLTSAVFLSFGIAGGLLLLAWLLALFGEEGTRRASQFALVALLVAWGVKAAWWRRAAKATLISAGSGTGDATGLGRLGGVRPFEPPHTSPNYLMREMAFELGRKRARALRRVAVWAGAVLPLLLVLLATYASVAPAALLLIALLVHLAGMLAERWLFFAEARHAVASFYGIGQADGAVSSRAML
ncbi:MAG: dibenzothiophene desulfurase [Ahrensia sp.]|nr:dibenzothiophene desulfurase [Ahrensia sp.]